ncbi:unnamed protein product [Orchesella dallaii]|uniref:Transmembrane protein n=1 Tax=Orchesella dallaii TaxID=48710 RepID=A0ABP1PSN4_9HEXA
MSVAGDKKQNSHTFNVSQPCDFSIVTLHNNIKHKSKHFFASFWITMNSIRFHFTHFAERFLNSFSEIKSSVSNGVRTIFKDSRQRVKIFVYFNLFVSSANLLLFCVKNELGAKRVTPVPNHLIFLSVIFLQWIIAIALIRAYNQRLPIHCQLWCLTETLVAVSFLFLALPWAHTVVFLALPGAIVLVISTFIKLYGLWVIYYFSLECASNSGWKMEKENNIPSASSSKSNEPFVTFATKNKAPPPPINRKDTDQTSIESSNNPQSPASCDADSALSSPRFIFTEEGTTNHQSEQHELNFFGHGEQPGPSYSDVMMKVKASTDCGELIPPGNIILSDLMCGGTSKLNSQ